FEDPLRGVPLLSRPTFIRRQDPVDDPGKRIELRTRRRPAPPVSGWDRKRQHLGYCPRVNAKLPRRFPSAQTLDLYRVTNPPIKLHHLHPPPSATTGYHVCLRDGVEPVRHRSRLDPLALRGRLGSGYPRSIAAACYRTAA